MQRVFSYFIGYLQQLRKPSRSVSDTGCGNSVFLLLTLSVTTSNVGKLTVRTMGNLTANVTQDDQRDSVNLTKSEMCSSNGDLTNVWDWYILSHSVQNHLNQTLCFASVSCCSQHAPVYFIDTRLPVCHLQTRQTATDWPAFLTTNNRCINHEWVVRSFKNRHLCRGELVFSPTWWLT